MTLEELRARGVERKHIEGFFYALRLVLNTIDDKADNKEQL
jgi:hypothetical protein